MSKKDFIALADMVREHNRVANNRLKNGDDSMVPFSHDQLDTLASFCMNQNGNFMLDRWMGYVAGTNGKNGGHK